MLRIDFEHPLDAFEIRDPILEVCRDAANGFGLYAGFHQPQQPALSGWSHSGNRVRIGNGKHKDWFINFQPEELNVSRPTVVGKLAIKSLFAPDDKQFGGFTYGKYGEPRPTYNFVTIHTASELPLYQPVDPDPKMLEIVYEVLEAVFCAQGALFDIVTYSHEQDYASYTRQAS